MNHILVTSADYNRDDAARCVAWVLEYLRKQAALDGIPAARVTTGIAGLIDLRTTLRGDAPELARGR